MKYFEAKETLSPIAVFRLENGVILFVYDGYAEGSDGETYYHIGKEDENGDLISLGWSCDVSKPTILNM